jgi:hypothetical protein
MLKKSATTVVRPSREQLQIIDDGANDIAG